MGGKWAPIEWCFTWLLLGELTGELSPAAMRR